MAPAAVVTAGGPGDAVRAVVVVGAGQAGLSAAYHLRRAGLDPLVLDATYRMGAAPNRIVI